jgi:hypothetical protein
MNSKIEIIQKDFDKDSIIIILKKNNENQFFAFGLCDFENEMEHWDLTTKLVDFEGEKGFLFNKNINYTDIEMEIKRFIKHNNLENAES